MDMPDLALWNIVLTAILLFRGAELKPACGMNTEGIPTLLAASRNKTPIKDASWAVRTSET
jgi:hypothetical protein